MCPVLNEIIKRTKFRGIVGAVNSILNYYTTYYITIDCALRRYLHASKSSIFYFERVVSLVRLFFAYLLNLFLLDCVLMHDIL